MELREFFSEDAIRLDVAGTTKEDVLKELIALLKLDEKSQGMLFKMLKRRENLGSTGIGRGITSVAQAAVAIEKAGADLARPTGPAPLTPIQQQFFADLALNPTVKHGNHGIEIDALEIQHGEFYVDVLQLQRTLLLDSGLNAFAVHD